MSSLRMMRVMPRRGLAAIAAAVMAAGLLSACGSSSSGSGSGGSGKKHVTIAFFEGTPSLIEYNQAGNGAQAAGAADGSAKVIADGPQVETATAVTAFADNMEQSAGPDGFATNPCIPTAWTTVYAKFVHALPNDNSLAYNCHYAVSAGQTTPPGAETYVGINYLKQAGLMARTAIKEGHLTPSTTGTVLVGSCFPGATQLVDEVNSIHSAVRQLLPKVKFVTFGTNYLSQTTNTANWVSEFARSAHVVFATGVCAQDTQSMLVLKNRGIGGNFVAGVDDPASPAQLQAIADGKIAAGVSQDYWVQGYVSAKLLIDGARGKALPKGWINTGLSVITKGDAKRFEAAAQSAKAASPLYTPLAKQVLASLPARTKPLAQSYAP